MLIRQKGMWMKRMMAIALWMTASLAWGSEATHRQAVEELMQVLSTANVVQGWRQRLDGNAVDVINEALAGKTESQLNDAQRAAIEQFSEKARSSLDQALDWQRFRDPVARIYMENYSESEVRELLAFYRSPLGKKAMQQGPRVADAMNSLIRSQLQSTLPEFQRIGQEFNREFARVSKPGARAPERQASQPAPALAAGAAVATGVNPKTGR
jgi:hypothetical protein